MGVEGLGRWVVRWFVNNEGGGVTCEVVGGVDNGEGVVIGIRVVLVVVNGNSDVSTSMDDV